jgi:hypothetical protein
MPYPEQAELMRDLVLNDHTILEDTPLSLAIYFESRRVPNEECLFEVAHRFGLDEVSDERSIYQIQFGPTLNFPLPAGDRLRIFLTNPIEAVYAIENGWPEIYDLSVAMNAGRYEVIYERPDDVDTRKVLNALAMYANALLQDAVPA